MRKNSDDDNQLVAKNVEVEKVKIILGGAMRINNKKHSNRFNLLLESVFYCRVVIMKIMNSAEMIFN